MKYFIVNELHVKPEPIIIFENSCDSELIHFVKMLTVENGDIDFSIIGCSDALEYINDICGNLKLYDEATFWAALGDVCVDENDDIDEDFIIFDKGTDKFEIWRWFEEYFDTQIGGKYL